MNTREIAEEYRLTHWAGIMRERSESGLSIKDFCKSAGFHENVYFYWQRKLREAACEQLLIAAKGRKPEISEVPSGWAVCDVTEIRPVENAVSVISGQAAVSSGHNQNTTLLESKASVVSAAYGLKASSSESRDDSILPEPKSGAVTIDIGKSRITANADVDADLLAKVCRVLTSLC